MNRAAVQGTAGAVEGGAGSCSGGRMSKHLWLGNLNTKVPRSVLKAVFEHFGAVEDVVTFPGAWRPRLWQHARGLQQGGVGVEGSLCEGGVHMAGQLGGPGVNMHGHACQGMWGTSQGAWARQIAAAIQGVLAQDDTRWAMGWTRLTWLAGNGRGPLPVWQQQRRRQRRRQWLEHHHHHHQQQQQQQQPA